jgi:hypothetical protein
MKRTIVYIDGFNLYYGAVKGTPHKWLDIMKMSKLLLPKNAVERVKYFTAPVTARASDPDQPTRQQTYFRALRSVSGVEIIEGSFLVSTVKMRLATPPQNGSAFVDVIKTEEKGSDVNIGAHLVHDAHLGAFEVAVVITNDSDLAEPVRIVTTELVLPVGVVNPRQSRVSFRLQKWASFTRELRPWMLAQAQFPTTLADKTGEISKPIRW